ncbi:hypothetical protein B0A53_04879 [Rhodotorula sp. CCFEE 5036]|nr:hypothetical protein B0A53_04879 [Rhodotorula sp. CCFEE 5036]
MAYSTVQPLTASEGGATSPNGGAAEAQEKKPVAKPALSASLVLLAPLDTPTADGFDYRVLLLKRHAKSRTYDSAHVMPGGNIDPIDVDATTWSSFFPEPAHDNIQQSTDLSSRLTAPELQALKLCALRETFEESGVLLLEPEPRPLGFNSSVLASLVKKILPGSSSSSSSSSEEEGTPAERWSALSPEKKQYWREEVHRDGKRFVDLLRSLGHDARPALSLLTHWSNWVTPTLLPRRFDTHFFIAVLPPAASPLKSSSASSSPAPTHHESLVSSDGVETTSADWLTPAEGVRRALAYSYALAQGQSTTATALSDSAAAGASSSETPIILHPPQFNLLAELAQNHRSLASLLDRARSSSGSASSTASLLVKPRRVVPFTPQVVSVQDDAGKKRRATVLPGDEAYSYPSSGMDSSLSRPGQRNRTYVLPPMKGQQGLVVEGCLRRGVHKTLGPGWEDMSAGDSGPSIAKL